MIHGNKLTGITAAVIGLAMDISLVFAAPVIDTGRPETTVAHGNQFTISGSAFGPQAKVLYFCSMSGQDNESFTLGTTCEIQQRPIADGEHTCDDSHPLGNNEPRYDTQIFRTPFHTSSAKSIHRHNPNISYSLNDEGRNNCYRSAMKFDFGALRPSIYVTTWMYANVNPFNISYQVSMSGNIKFWTFHDPRIITAAGELRNGIYGWLTPEACDPELRQGHYSECNNYMTGYTHPDPELYAQDYKKKWARMEQWAKYNTPGNFDGVLNTNSYNERGFEKHDTRGPRWKFDESGQGWRDLDAFEYNSPWRGLYPTDTSSATQECRLDQSPELNGCVNDTDWHFQDLYIAETRARVELCDSPTWEGRSSCELQVILPEDKWDNDQITFTLRQGGFSDLRYTYVYVVDENEVANSSGFPIDGSRPEPPANLRAQ
jgi:hypothetical protein